MIKKEWSRLLKNWWLKVVIVAIIAIPSIYAGVFLGSIWDPYGNTQDIPVAVVNQDQQVDYNGATLNIGKTLADSLMKNDSMNFKTVNQKEANQGLSAGDYYMVISIPTDFSKNATTLLDQQPQKMILNYTTNPGSSYIASKMDDSAIAKIKAEVSTTVTKTYAQTIFDQLGTVGKGMTDAADGSNQIKDGSNQLIVGNKTISDNLQVLATSTITFKDGSSSLTNGLNIYFDGVATVNQGTKELNTGLSTLNNNSPALSSGIEQINTGLQQLETGSKNLEAALDDAKNSIDTQLNLENEQNIKALITPNPVTGKSALETLNLGIQALNQSINNPSTNNNPSLNDYNKIIDNYLVAANTSVNDINSAYVSAIQAALSQNTGNQLDQETIMNIVTSIKSDSNITAANTSAVTNIKTAQGTINAVYSNLTETISTLANGSRQALPGANQAITQLYNGLKTVQAGLGSIDSNNTLINGANSIHQGSLSLLNGSNSLNTGFTAYKNGVFTAMMGSNQLLTGTEQLVSNRTTLSSGAKQLNDGALQISDGANQLADGSITLGTGLTTLQTGANTLTTSLSNGASQVNSIKDSDDTIDMLANPVDTKHKEISVVENNGHGMAPYMMSVGLYVACMAFTLMYPLFNQLETAKSGFKYWLSKATVWFSVSTIAAVIMIASLMLFCNFTPQQLLLTFIFAIIVGAASMALVTLLSIICGKIGEFVLLVFMVINLGGSAGTYPLETSSAIFKALHPFMPFTYSVDGFRKVISMTDTSINTEIAIFGIIIIGCSLLTILAYNYRINKPNPLIPQAFENVNE